MNKKWVLKNKIIEQILYIGILPLLFYLSAWNFLKDKFEYRPTIITVSFAGGFLWVILFIFYIVYRFRHFEKGMIWRTLHTYRYGVALFIILLNFTFQRIFILPRWDGLLYYSELVKRCIAFDFTFQGLIDGFRIFHPNHGYFCFLAIGVYLFDNPLIGTEFMQMCLYIIASLCYYGILRIIFPKISEKICFLGTLFFAISPLVYGIEHYISSDNGILYYLVILIYVTLKGYSLLELSVAVLLILSKETGVLYYVVFYGILFLGKVIRSIKNEHRMKGEDFIWILFRMIPGLVGIGVILIWSSASSFTWMNNMQKTVMSNQSNVVLQGFGFNGEYIIVKLKQIFLLNFIWVEWLILLFGVFRYLFGRRMRKSAISPFAISLLGIEVVCLLFNLSFVTIAEPRYINVNSFFVAFGDIWVINEVLADKKWRINVLYLLSALLFISNFYSMDPVGFLVYRSFKIGSKSYMYLPIYDNPDMYSSDIYADGTMYNCQNEYFTLLEEKMLRTLQYDGTIPLMEIDINKGQWDDPWKYDYIYMQLEGMYGRTTCYWDPDRGKFSETFSKKNTDIPMNVVYFNSEQFVDDGKGYRDTPLPDLAYMLLLPRQDIQGILQTVKTRYVIQQTYDISFHGMSIYVYKVEKK